MQSIIDDFNRSGLSREDLQGMTPDDIRAYFSVANYRHMFGLEQVSPPEVLAALAEYALDLAGSS